MRPGEHHFVLCCSRGVAFRDKCKNDCLNCMWKTLSHVDCSIEGCPISEYSQDKSPPDLLSEQVLEGALSKLHSQLVVEKDRRRVLVAAAEAKIKEVAAAEAKIKELEKAICDYEWIERRYTAFHDFSRRFLDRSIRR